eukprot:scaffold231437_cov30-Tisochrysis_lutea.AAC.3
MGSCSPCCTQDIRGLTSPVSVRCAAPAPTKPHIFRNRRREPTTRPQAPSRGSKSAVAAPDSTRSNVPQTGGRFLLSNVKR